MDIPFAVNDIRIRKGLKGYKRKSLTPRRMTGAEGLSAFIDIFVCKMVTFQL